MNFQAQEISGTDGKVIHVHRWSGGGGVKPRAIIQIAHGMAEHSLRYDHFARYFVGNGYTVFANDHRGHGKAIGDGAAGYFAECGGWKLVLDDMVCLNKKINSLYKETPVFLVGHSMGSFFAQQFMVEHGQHLQGVVLSGASYTSRWLASVFYGVAILECLRIGARERSRLIQWLSFGSYNRQFRPTRTEFDWLSRSADQVDRYIDDPLCGFQCTNQLWVDLLSGISRLFSRENKARMPLDMPVYVMSGARDPLISKKKQLYRLKKEFQSCGMRDVQCDIFPECRHEIFNEVNREAIYLKLVAWMDLCLK